MQPISAIAYAFYAQTAVIIVAERQSVRQANAILEENYCGSNIPKKTSEKLVASRIEEEWRQPKCARRISLLQANSDEGAIVYRLGQEIFIL